ncbi:MAG TPA: asparagine synthase-related protein [Candidatus Sulfotelmatobacter sp.]|jgi:asparagine synthase (glutamine-hydrolysing)|nr:asparagine synthase-related protein [Candidatus Sulfotelmatobacter sp.]
MSGFFGMMRSDGVAVEPRFLDQVAQRLRFRGPDGGQTWAKDGLGTCFAYLETGTRHQSRSQPVRLGERYTLIGEVRLDSREPLIEELLEMHQPATRETADQELLLLAWSVWGERALTEILGDFSFALWDASLRSLFCARDFSGARPFFYAWHDGVFCFSNTLNVLRLAPGISDALDDFFVRDFLLNGLCSDPTRTVWRDIQRLPAGHRLILSGGQIQVQRFQNLPIEEPLRLKDAGEYLESYRELLGQAVGDRLPEAKVSLYLSGGLDSGSVCATAARIARENGNFPALKAFTISWRPLFDDPEPQFAQLTARHLGLAHEILEEASIRPDERQAAISPEPSAELFLDREGRFYQTISHHARVILAGDGGDDVLSGQSWPYLKYLYERGAWGEIFSSFGGYFGTHGRFPPLRGGFRNRIRRWVGAKDVSNPAPSWLKDGFAERTRAESEERFHEQPPIEEHPLHPDAYRGLHSGYWASVHETEDAGFTGVTLETRAPLLDLRVLRFLLRLPPVPWCVNKELARRAMKGGLPDKILARAKTPLLEDPIQVCWKRCGWRPSPGKNPPKMIHEFVEWDRWLATLENSKGYFQYEYLFPLSFSLWLKAIEKEGWIK